MSDLQDIIAHNAQRAYEQGVTRERERWETWLARIRTWTEGKSADYQEGALWEQQRIIKLLEDNFGEFVDMPLIELEALIKGEQK